MLGGGERWLLVTVTGGNGAAGGDDDGDTGKDKDCAWVGRGLWGM